MDLEQLENRPEVEAVELDVEELVTTAQDIVELEADVETAFSNVHGLAAMTDEYETILDNADKESITESQLTSLRAGIVAGMVAANADASKILGVDVESKIIVPSSSLAYDLEGVKEFVKKMWEKFKAGLVKVNAFFKKLFLKFINMVSFRKGTLEKLEEDVAAAATIKTEIKDKGLATKLGYVNFYNDKTDTDIDCTGYTEVLNYKHSKDTLKVLEEGIKEVEDRIKDIKANPGQFTTIVGVERFKSVSNGILKLSSSKLLSKDAIRASSKIENFIVGGATGNTVNVLGVTAKGSISKMVVKWNVKPKTVKVSSAALVALLKDASSVNDDFKSIINDIFGVVDASMDATEALSDLGMSSDIIKLTDNAKKEFSTASKTLKNVVSLTPWLAYKQGLSIYKEVGVTIALAKAALKDDKK